MLLALPPAPKPQYLLFLNMTNEITALYVGNRKSCSDLRVLV